MTYCFIKFVKTRYLHYLPLPIGLQTWPPQAILVSDWSILKKVIWLLDQSETRITCGGHMLVNVSGRNEQSL
jgi:hypothetical protein